MMLSDVIRDLQQLATRVGPDAEVVLFDLDNDEEIESSFAIGERDGEATGGYQIMVGEKKIVFEF